MKGKSESKKTSSSKCHEISSSGSSRSNPHSRSKKELPDDETLENRRVQNNATARRGRERRKGAEMGIRKQVRENEQEIRRLEDQVLVLETRLEKKRQEKQKKSGGKVIPGQGEFFEHQSFFGKPF